MRPRFCVSTSAPASEPSPRRGRRAGHVGLVLVLALAVAPRPVGAAEASALRLGVVDLATLRREADGAKVIARQLEAFIVGYQTDIEKEEAELRSAQEQLTAQKAALSAEAYAEERRRWEQAVAEAQRRFLHRRQAMDQARAEAWRRLNGALDQAIRDVAAERGLSLVVRRDQIVFAAPDLEITEAVLRRLNQALPAPGQPGGDG